MATCGFCKRDDFSSRQSVCAHLKWCSTYLQQKQRKAALGTSSRDPVPKAQPDETSAPPIASSSPLPPPNDPLAPFKKALHAFEQSHLHPGETQETPPQRRRRVLQAAKLHARTSCWAFLGTITAEMRAAATLAVERELRHEPIEEWPIQEVNDVAAGICDRVYRAFQRRQQKEAGRCREADERKRVNQRNEERRQAELRNKKAVYLEVGQRRLVAFLKTHACSPLEKIQFLAESLAQLDATLTGGEPLADAHAVIDVILQIRAAEWDAEEVASEAKRQEEWWDLATVVSVVLILGYLYVKAPDILQWLMKILAPEPAEEASPQQPTGEALPRASDEGPPRPIRCVRRPSPSPVPESPLSPSMANDENGFLE